MILDYNSGFKGGVFILRVKRKDADISALMREHGLDLSVSASNNTEAVLYTREPYAAVYFEQGATERARNELGPLIRAIEASRASDGPYCRVPADRELWPFQRANVAYALGRRNTLVGDQPGLGKTPTAIAFANEVRAKRVLVVCPASIRLQWAKRIREWTTMRWPYSLHTILHSRHGVNDVANWTVVSYELARMPAIGGELAKGTYDVLILDEAHYLKDTNAGRTRAIFGGGRNRDFAPIAERCGAILALTGTPLPNRPREAYTLARALCWDAIDWASEDHFKLRYNPSRRVDIGDGRFAVDERTGRHAELQARLRGNFMSRHLKRDVLPQLKLPKYDLIQLEETGPVKAALEAERLLDIDPDHFDADISILGHVAAVRRMMGIALAPQAADYIDMLLQGGEEKLVVFGWHIEVLDVLQERLGKWGVVRIDGRTGAARKEFLVNQFVHNGKIQVCLGNLQSMGVGTDGLQIVSSHALIVEPDWVHGNNEQAFDRLDRGGQRCAVQGDIMVAPGSLAERILGAALRKGQIVERTLDWRAS